MNNGRSMIAFIRQLSKEKPKNSENKILFKGEWLTKEEIEQKGYFVKDEK